MPLFMLRCDRFVTSNCTYRWMGLALGFRDIAPECYLCNMEYITSSVLVMVLVKFLYSYVCSKYSANYNFPTHKV